MCVCVCVCVGGGGGMVVGAFVVGWLQIQPFL